MELKLVSRLSETKYLFCLYRFNIETMSFDVLIKLKQPKHQPKPKASTEAPKMGTVKIPDYLEFDQLKIDFKNQ